MTEIAEAEFVRQRNKDRRATLYVALISGFVGVTGAVGTHAIDEASKGQRPRLELFTLKAPMDNETPVPLYRHDTESGDVWFARRSKDGKVLWVKIENP